MKILMMHNDYRKAGGERSSVAEDVEGLRALGHEVRYFEVSNSRAKRSDFGYAAAGLRSSHHDSLKKELEEFQPHIVHAQNMFPLLGGPAVDVLRLFSAPWIRTLRNYRLRCLAGNCFRDGRTCTSCSSASAALPGILHGCYRESRSQSVAALGYAAVESRAVRRHPPRLNIVLSDAMIPFLGESVNYAPLVVRGNSIPAGSKPPPIVDRPYDCIYAGRLEREKGVETVLDLARQFPLLSFVIAGEGSLEPQVVAESKILPNLTVVGLQTKTNLRRLFEESTFTLLPTRWAEPFGRVALEAASRGSIPLASPLGGPAAVLSTFSTALLLNERHQDWTQFLSKWISKSPRGLQEVSEDLWQWTLSAHSPAELAKELESIYASALSAS